MKMTGLRFSADIRAVGHNPLVWVGSGPSAISAPLKFRDRQQAAISGQTRQERYCPLREEAEDVFE